MLRILPAVLLVSAMVASCASYGPDYVRYEPGQAFRAIEASGPYQVEFAAGPAHAVEVIEARDRRGLQIEVHGDALRIRRACSMFCNSNGTLAVIRVTAPAIEAIDVSMGVDARATGLDSETLSIDVSMGAALTAAGACGRLQADVSMGADLDAEGLACRAVGVDASMGADVAVRASESVDVDASMGADVRVAGQPAQRASGESMGGSISYQ